MKVNIRDCHKWIVLFFIFITISCNEGFTPKPRGYYRLDFPAKEYKNVESECGFKFEIPNYTEIKPVTESFAEACWYTIEFKDFNATVYLTYKPVNHNLSAHIEDVRTIAYKHIIKADDIIETLIKKPEHSVYGIMYDIKGNTASSVNFYITDSVEGFLSGSLYFNVRPNKDSLGPAIDYFRKDIIHLINTFEWN